MVNLCCVCGRKNHGIIPKAFEESEEIYMSGVCGKCGNEDYPIELLDVEYDQIEKFIQERIRKYGD